jgi:hypothetical protein
MSSNETVVDAYKRINKQLIIIISGLSCVKKSYIGKKIADAFKINFLNEHYYRAEEHREKAKLKNGVDIINYDTDEAIDWDKLNDDIEKKKSEGVVVSGFAFPLDKIDSKIDFHIHLGIKKQKCLEKRKEHLEKINSNDTDKEKTDNSDDSKKPEVLSQENEQYKMNQYTYPYYLNIRERSKYDKQIDANIDDINEIYSNTFDEIIKLIEDKLYK